MTSSHVPGAAAHSRRCTGRPLDPLRFARVAVAICALALGLGAAPAHAFLQPLGQFGAQGSASGQFQVPLGLAVDQRNGRVYVADSANARIEKFNARGKFVAAWGWGVDDGEAKSEVCRNKVSCQAGITGSGAGQLANPTSVAVDSSRGPSSGYAYVADAGNNVVVKFNANGKYLSTIDGSTTPQGAFSSLAGVAVDQRGRLWTASRITNNVDEFDSQGNSSRSGTTAYSRKRSRSPSTRRTTPSTCSTTSVRRSASR